jgi:hypothetical protein
MNKIIVTAFVTVSLIGATGCGQDQQPLFKDMSRQEQRQVLGNELVFNYCQGAASRAQRNGCLNHVTPRYIWNLDTPAARQARHQAFQDIADQDQVTKYCNNPDPEFPC